MRLLTLLRNTIFGATIAALPVHVSAQGVPTNDIRNYLQELKNFDAMLKDFGLQTDQLNQLIEQASLLEEQLVQLEELEALLSDPSQVIGLAMGDDLDGLLEGEFSADIVDTIVSGASGDWGGITGGSSDEIIGRIAGAFESAGTSQEEVEALAGSDNPVVRNNATATASNAATSAAAEVAYEEAGQARERVVRLVDEIPQLDSLKKSVDHNTRVTAELAIAMAAMWQLESVQTINDGMGGVLDAATAAEIQRYNDFTVPDFE